MTGAPPPAAFEAVLFDMDGVLVDSEPFWREVERRVFAGLGLTLTDDDMRATMGLRIEEVVAHWHRVGPWEAPAPAAVVADIVAGMAEVIRARGAALPGVHAAIARCRGAGLRLGLATSSHHVLIDAVLERLELGDAFEVRHSAEDEARGKPDPAVYLGAARRLDVDPRRCVAIEDSRNGIRSAKAAGMRCVAVPEPGAPPEVTAEADVVLPSLEALTVDALLGP